MTYLIISFLQVIILLGSVMTTPVKTVKTLDYHFSNDTIDVNKFDKEKSKQITNCIKDNENKIIKLTSIIDKISELSNNHKKYYENFRSFVIKKNNKYSMLPNNLKQEMTSNNNYKKKIYDSKIFYVRLPTVPYWITSLINLPIDFISNGKPSSIYQWGKPSKRKRSSPIIKLEKGPYEFNGRPTSLFLVGSNSQTSVAASKKKNSSSST